MLEQTKRISFRISSVLSKVEPEPDLHTGSGSNQKVPAPAPQHCLQYKKAVLAGTKRAIFNYFLGTKPDSFIRIKDGLKNRTKQFFKKDPTGQCSQAQRCNLIFLSVV